MKILKRGKCKKVVEKVLISKASKVLPDNNTSLRGTSNESAMESETNIGKKESISNSKLKDISLLHELLNKKLTEQNKLTTKELSKKVNIIDSFLTRRLTEEHKHLYNQYEDEDKGYYIKQGITIIEPDYNIPCRKRSADVSPTGVDVYDVIGKVFLSPNNFLTGGGIITLTKTAYKKFLPIAHEEHQLIIVYRPSKYTYLLKHIDENLTTQIMSNNLSDRQILNRLPELKVKKKRYNVSKKKYNFYDKPRKHLIEIENGLHQTIEDRLNHWERLALIGYMIIKKKSLAYMLDVLENKLIQVKSRPPARGQILSKLNKMHEKNQIINEVYRFYMKQLKD